LRQELGRQADTQIDPPGKHIRHRSAAVRHELKIGVCFALKQQPGNMHDAARAISPLRCLAGIGFKPGKQLLQAIRRNAFAADDQKRTARNQGDRFEIVLHVVVQGIDGAVGNVRGPIAFDQRVAIGRRARDPADADAAGRAWRVFNDDGLAKRSGHAPGDNARNRIGAAACGIRDHERNGTRWVIRRCRGSDDGQNAGHHERRKDSFQHEPCRCSIGADARDRLRRYRGIDIDGMSKLALSL